MKYQNMLVITNNFPDLYNRSVGNIFVKEQIQSIKKYFKNITVISPVAYGMERLRNTTYEDYTFDNVSVYFPKYFNIPFCYFWPKCIWLSFEYRAISDLIQKKRISFDIIHAHFTWPSGAVAVELKKKYRVPLIITEHTSETYLNAVYKKDAMYIHTWYQSDAIIRVKDDLSLLSDIRIPQNKLYYIPNGYDPLMFSQQNTLTCRNKLNLPLDKKIILNVGNLYSKLKGHRYLIEAMAQIVKNRDDVLCIIIGSGKLENELNKKVKYLQLENYVKLIGGRSHEEISIWMNSCDIFVLPSLKESFGVVQIEAMACGKPVIATYNGGSEEIIISKSYGYLVEPANSKQLSEMILRALDENWDCGMIRNYSSKYSWDIVSKQLLDLYVGVTKGGVYR